MSEINEIATSMVQQLQSKCEQLAEQTNAFSEAVKSLSGVPFAYECVDLLSKWL